MAKSASDPLRGSSPYVPAAPIYTLWSGFYAGGQWGYGGAQYDFGGATQWLYAFMLRELALEAQQHPSTWKVLGKADKSGYSAEGFAGFNTQWDEVILGFDVHYNRSNFFASAPATPISRRPPPARRRQPASRSPFPAAKASRIPGSTAGQPASAPIS